MRSLFNRKRYGSAGMVANSIKLISAGTLVQVFAFLLLPLVGRLYTQSEMGNITIFLSLAGVLSLLANGRYDHATVLASTPTRANLLLATALRCNLFFTLLLVPLVFIINFFLPFTRYASQTHHILLLPVAVFSMAALSAFSSWNNARNQYSRIGSSQVAQGLSNNTLRVALGFLSLAYWGLQAAVLLSTLLGIYPLVRKQFLGKALKNITRRRVHLTARYYSNFPKYSLPQALIDILAGTSISLLLPLHYTAAEVGLYGMAYMLAGRPTQLISDSLSRVWFRRVAEYRNNRASYLPYIKRFVRWWLILSIPGSILLSFIMKQLVVWVVGEEWLISAFIIVAMLPTLVLSFISSIFNFIPDLFGLQKQYMQMLFILWLVQMAVIVIGSALLPFNQFIILYFAERPLDVLVQITWFYIISHRYEKQLSHSK